MATSYITEHLRAAEQAGTAAILDSVRTAREAAQSPWRSAMAERGRLVDVLSFHDAVQPLIQRPRYDAMIAGSSALDLFTKSSALDVFTTPSAVDSLAKPFTALDALETVRRPAVVEMFDQMAEREALMERIFGPVIDEPEVRSHIAPPNPQPTSDDVLADVRAEVEDYLDARSLVALRRLNGARDAIRRGDAESLAQAATSCRRALQAIADVVMPPVSGAVQLDRQGRELKVGPEHYKNRLLLFLEGRVISKSRRALDVAQLDTLDTQLTLLVRGANKGVHDDITLGDARRLYVATLQVLAEIARHDLY